MLRGLRYAAGRTLVLTMSGLAGLDSRTGREVWRIPLISTDTMFGDAIADGIWYVGGLDVSARAGYVAAINCATGRILWKYTPPQDVAFNGTSGALAGAVYITVYDPAARQRQAWAIDMSAHRVRWKSPVGQDDTDVYALAGGRLVFVSANGGYGMTAFNAATGRVAWQTRYPCSFGSEGPAGKTLISFTGNTVAGLDVASGRRVWQATPSAGLIAQVLANDGDETYFVWDGARLGAYRALAVGGGYCYTSPGGFASSTVVALR